MHFIWVGAVKIDNIGRNSFAEVGFDSVNSKLGKVFDPVCEPFACIGISEINYGKPRLPEVCLENGTVLIFNKIAFFSKLLESSFFKT